MKRKAESVQAIHYIADQLWWRVSSVFYMVVETSSLSKKTFRRLERNGAVPAILIVSDTKGILAIIDTVDGDALCRDNTGEGNLLVDKMIERFPFMERWVIDIRKESISIEKCNCRNNPKTYRGAEQVRSHLLGTKVSAETLLGIRNVLSEQQATLLSESAGYDLTKLRMLWQTRY